ncbi:MAG: hypothetical protein RI909_1263 [Bacteroidota bacterium]
MLSALLLIFLGAFSSCNLFDKVEDASFDITLPLTFSISDATVPLLGQPTEKAYTGSELLNAASNAEVASFANKIKAFKVNKITYTISGANPNTVTFTNSLMKISSTGTTIAAPNSVSLTNTVETVLTSNETGFNELAEKLLDDKQELIQLNGTLSKTPVAFSVTFKFYVTVTISAL